MNRQIAEKSEELPEDLRDIHLTELHLDFFPEEENVYISQQSDPQNESNSANNQLFARTQNALCEDPISPRNIEQGEGFSTCLKQNESNCEGFQLQHQVSHTSIIAQVSNGFTSSNTSCPNIQNVYEPTPGTSKSVRSEPVQCPLSVQNMNFINANYESNSESSGSFQEHDERPKMQSSVRPRIEESKLESHQTHASGTNLNSSRERNWSHGSISKGTGINNPTLVRTQVSCDVGCSQFQTLQCVEMPSTSFACNNRSENCTREDNFVCNECEKSSTQRVILVEESKGNYRSCLSEQSFDITNSPRHNRTQKKYTCTVCGKRCLEENFQNKDASINTQKRPFLCEVCGKSFTKKTKLTDHERIHTKEKPFKCELCDKCFTKKCNLNSHKLVHTKEKPFKCELCGKCFSHKSSLNRHKLVHAKEKPFKCELCGKCFSQKGNLNTHKVVHTKEKPFKCELCGKCYSQKSSLNSHKVVHTEERPFHCELCGKGFKRKDDLNYHMLIHAKEKLYQCEVCDKRFTYKSNLNSHKKLHTKEKPFKCELCGKCFTYKWNLNSHKAIHTKERPFQCQVCGNTFALKFFLKSHLKTHKK